jgi:nicotinamide mononucleotide transporter
MTDPLEIAATALTLVCVILAVRRSLWQFPTGIAGSGLGFIVFWNAGLVSSAILQPLFIALQLYGWWFWLRGQDEAAPRIGRTAPATLIFACLGAVGLAGAGASILEALTPARLAFWDGAILCLSLVAQWLLSLKRIENWLVWIAVNALSVFVYGAQGLWLYCALYVFFFFNAIWGWWEWRRELRSYGARVTQTARDAAQPQVST